MSVSSLSSVDPRLPLLDSDDAPVPAENDPGFPSASSLAGRILTLDGGGGEPVNEAVGGGTLQRTGHERGHKGEERSIAGERQVSARSGNERWTKAEMRLTSSPLV